ncbi:MAG: DUF3822 family protein [Dysgonomonas sp.]
MFLPDSIDLGHSEKYILSIRIKSNGFMFSITDPDSKRNYCLRETTFSGDDNLLDNVQRIVFELSFLTQEYKRTNVVIVSEEYDLVPADYFDKKKKEELYNYTHSDKVNNVLSGLVESQDVVILYGVEKDLYDFLSRNLWAPVFYHHSNLLINLFEEKGRIRSDISKMYLNFHGNLMDVICFSGSKLLHSLTYENEAPANQIYFVLKLWERFGFDQMHDYIYISGHPDEQIMTKLQLYVRNVERSAPPSEVYLWNEDAQKAPLDLLTLSL